jgi:hypothetical protein
VGGRRTDGRAEGVDLGGEGVEFGGGVVDLRGGDLGAAIVGEEEGGGVGEGGEHAEEEEGGCHGGGGLGVLLGRLVGEVTCLSCSGGELWGKDQDIYPVLLILRSAMLSRTWFAFASFQGFGGLESYVNLVGSQYLPAVLERLFIRQYQGLDHFPTPPGQ